MCLPRIGLSCQATQAMEMANVVRRNPEAIPGKGLTAIAARIV
jgi:hypothetical protein